MQVIIDNDIYNDNANKQKDKKILKDEGGGGINTFAMTVSRRGHFWDNSQFRSTF